MLDLEEAINNAQIILKMIKVPEEVDLSSISNFKLPGIIYVINNCLGLRFFELGNNAITLLKEEQQTSSTLLIKGTIEDYALLNNLNLKISHFLNESSVINFKELDQFVRKTSYNSKIFELPKNNNPLNIMDSIRNLSDDLQIFYNEMNEFAHPNYLGVGYSYSEIKDYKQSLVKFKKNTSLKNKKYKISILCGVISFFVKCSQEIEDAMPKLVNNLERNQKIYYDL